MKSRRSTSILLLPMLLAGCGAAVDHPSLAPRANERLEAAEPSLPPPPPAPIPVDATREQRIALLVKQARDSDTRFRNALAEAVSAVGRGAGSNPGSESWTSAQEAVTRADSLRAPVSQALADLDVIQIASANDPNALDGTALSAAIADVVSLDQQERDAIAALKDKLNGP